MDLATADDATRGRRQALTDHKVLFFAGQRLDPDSQVALGNRMGRLTAAHPVVPGLDEAHAEIYSLDSAGQRVRRHLAHRRHLRDAAAAGLDPARRTLPRTAATRTGLAWSWPSRRCPSPCSGWPSSSPRSTTAPASSATTWRNAGQGEGSLWEGERFRAWTRSSTPWSASTPRPAARRCSSTPASPATSSGVSDAESRHLLDLFYAHITKPEHIVRHRWQLGDVAMWDNRATVHYANRDYGDARRVMHRITLRGDEPVGVGVLR